MFAEATLTATLMVVWSTRRFELEPVSKVPYPVEASSDRGDLDKLSTDSIPFEFVESQSSPANVAELKLAILKIITGTPGLDDVEIAEKMGRSAFEVSELLQKLAEDGLIEEAV
jgi:hypothetical protein